MKVREYKPKYNLIESVKCKADGTPILLNFLMNWEYFKKQFGDCYLYSVRVYNDTQTVSVAYGDENPIVDTYFLILFHLKMAKVMKFLKEIKRK